uniref:Armadillo repeat-containing protein 4 n=1 Tax=Lygus hesperus TaxID=30085 RepID=A0A0A9Z097_LYGHE
MKKSINLHCHSRSDNLVHKLGGVDGSTPLRIGQLSRKKEFNGSIDEDEDDNISISDSGIELSQQTISDVPWYLRGPKRKELEFVYFSDKDESSESEGDVLGETDDDFSSIDDSEAELSSSSSEDEGKKKKGAGEREEEDDDDEEEEEEKISDDLKGVEQIKKSPDDSSVESPSSKSDSRSIPSGTRSPGSSFGGGGSSKMIVNKKLAVTSEEQKEAELKYEEVHGTKSEEKELLQFDLERMREIKENLLKQKMALYEQDMSAYLTGKKKEDAMRETMRGATYWKIRKTIKFLKHADPYSTCIALNVLMEECELEDPENHPAIVDTGSVELFVNLLTVDWSQCRVGALLVLEALTENNDEMVELCMNLGMVGELYNIFVTDIDEELLVATRCLCNFVSIKRSRTVIRKAGIIPLLFYLIHRNPMNLLCMKMSDVVDPALHRKFEIAMGALYILTAIMRSRQVREELFDSGYLSVVLPLLESRDRLIIKAVIEGLLLCASMRKYRRRFELQEFVEMVCKHWKKHQEFVLLFLYKMSIGVVAREQIYETDVLSKVANFVMNTDNLRKDPYGFKYALGCLHRMGANHKGREFLRRYDVLEPLIRLLKQDSSSGYKLIICSILSLLSIFPENWKPIVQLGGLQCVLDIIFTQLVDMWLIAYCLKILGDVAHSEDAHEVLLAQPHTLHFLLILLNDGRPMITRYAARAIIPLTRVYTDYAEVMKAEADCLEVLMDQLEPMRKFVDDSNLKSAVCEALAAIMCDQNISETLNSLGLMQKIANLIETKNEAMQESICLLISMCAISDKQRTELGNLGIIEKLATYLQSPNVHVVIAAAIALWRSSFNCANSIRILHADIVKQFLEWSSSEYEELSEASLVSWKTSDSRLR